MQLLVISRLLSQSVTAFDTTNIFDDIFDYTTDLPNDTIQSRNDSATSNHTSQSRNDSIRHNATEPPDHVQQIYTAGCNSVISGFLYSDTTVYIDFNLTDAMDVVITNCPNYSIVPSTCTKCSSSDKSKLNTLVFDSHLDTIMFLKNSDGIDITDQSWNFCDGDNCDVPEICPSSNSESLLMKNLPPDQYRLELSAFYNSSDSFQVNVSCGDFSELMSGWDQYHCDDHNASLSDPSSSFILCDASISGHLTCGERKRFTFWLFEEDNVVFETCGSNFDTKLYLYNASTDNKVGEMIHGQSINSCVGGEDCKWTTVLNRYCDHDTYPQSETIPMMNLPVGLYYVDLFSWWTNGYGEYNLGIHCGVEMPEPFNGTLDHCNYVQLGTLQGELEELPYPFNESIQNDAVYPIGYCHDIKGIFCSFRFMSSSGRVYLQTFDQSNTCSMYHYQTASYSTINTYSNISDSIDSYAANRLDCNISTFCNALSGSAAYDTLSWISSGYESEGCKTSDDSMSSIFPIHWTVVICFCVTMYI